LLKFSYQEIEIETFAPSNVGKHQENFWNFNYIVDSYYDGLLVLPSESGAELPEVQQNEKWQQFKTFHIEKIQEFVGMKIWRLWDNFWFPSKQDLVWWIPGAQWTHREEPTE
jgi:hypothetical protein